MVISLSLTVHVNTVYPLCANLYLLRIYLLWEKIKSFIACFVASLFFPPLFPHFKFKENILLQRLEQTRMLCFKIQFSHKRKKKEKSLFYEMICCQKPLKVVTARWRERERLRIDIFMIHLNFHCWTFPQIKLDITISFAFFHVQVSTAIHKVTFLKKSNLWIPC